MDAAVRAPAEHAVDGVSKGAGITGDFRLKFLFPVMLDRMPCARRDLQADADAEPASGWVVELHGFQILVERIGKLPERDGLGVFDLLLSEEGIAVAAMAAVRAVARRWPLYAGAGSDLEIAQTFLDRALTAKIAVLVGIDRYAKLFS